MEFTFLIALPLLIVASFGSFMGKALCITKSWFKLNFLLIDVLILGVLEIAGVVLLGMVLIDMNTWKVVLNWNLTALFIFILISWGLHSLFVLLRSKKLKNSLAMGIIMSGFYPVLFSLIVGMFSLLHQG